MNSIRRKNIIITLLLIVQLAAAAQGVEKFFRSVNGISQLPVVLCKN